MPRHSDPDAFHTASDAGSELARSLDRDQECEPRPASRRYNSDDAAERVHLAAGLVGRKVTPAEIAAERKARSEWVAAADNGTHREALADEGGRRRDAAKDAGK